MTIYDQQGKIVEKKFYHSEWKLTDLLKARNDGLLTDEGEAWKYRYSHMDGTGGKYDLLFRREPVAIEAPDHLALVAAAYREVVRNILGVTLLVAPDGISHREGAESVRRQLAGFIETFTPADAKAHLTALLRAEYERGVREAADKCNALRDHEDTTDEEARGAMFCASDILDLLTQEGR